LTAEVVGEQGRAAEVIAATEQRIAEVRGLHDEGSTLAILGNTASFGVFSASEKAPISQLIAELGFVRPTAEQGPSDQGTAIMTSAELIGDHDADVVVVFDGNYYDAASVEAMPTYQSMPAVIDGRSH